MSLLGGEGVGHAYGLIPLGVVPLRVARRSGLLGYATLPILKIQPPDPMQWSLETGHLVCADAIDASPVMYIVSPQHKA